MRDQRERGQRERGQNERGQRERGQKERGQRERSQKERAHHQKARRDKANTKVRVVTTTRTEGFLSFFKYYFLHVKKIKISTWTNSEIKLFHKQVSHVLSLQELIFFCQTICFTRLDHSSSVS